MKAILVLMDTFRYDALELCGGNADLLPNFKRLKDHCVNYTCHYAGSLPCMPARRELHTGRYNFMHRGWGPLEPQDDSMPELLKKNGIYTHLVSDHYHYWDDGGATYHTRYSSWECVRGHESDPWKGLVGPVEMPEIHAPWNPEGIRKNYVNRKYMPEYKDSTLARTFDLGMDFIDANHSEDSWFLQIESFTPHEPFVNYPQYRRLLPDPLVGQASEWGTLTSEGDPLREEDTRNDYRTLLVECDHEMGRLLDRMDRYDLWEDTMILFTSDHGTLLGEHGEWNKNRQPLFQEVVHTPLLVWDPRDGRKGVEDASLNRMIDVPATILDYFNLPLPENMLGQPVRKGSCEGALFGYYGSYVCCTDGRYVYMRSAANPDNKPLSTYFLMPTELFHRFPAEKLQQLELVPGRPSTKGIPVLRTEGLLTMPPDFMYKYGTLLYDLAMDPCEKTCLPVREKGASDDECIVEKRMEALLIKLMEEADAPAEQFERLGLVRGIGKQG